MIRMPSTVGPTMRPPSPELLTAMPAFTGTGLVAFAIAALLAVAGIGLLWPRRARRREITRGPPVRSAGQDGAGRQPPEGQWLRLSGVIAAGATRADEASRAHAAAGNTLEALEHDIWMLRDDLARIDERPEAMRDLRHGETPATTIGIAA